MTGLPDGFGLVLDRSVRTFGDGATLAGGHPGRLVTLNPEGVAALSALLDGGPGTAGSRRLGNRLVEAGMAHPRPKAQPPTPPTATAGVPSVLQRVTVVVPVHDDSVALGRCLASLGSEVKVVVVDDGSDDPDAVARICHRHHARLIRRMDNGGPAAARNQALGVVDTDLIAFVDSDCRVTEGWLEGLIWLFDDPAIGAVAPRVRPDRSDVTARRSVLDGAAADGPAQARSVLARYADARSALDMGPEPSEVAPDKEVRYVPTAALVARRAAVGSGFDSDLRVGEDVDLVWRLLAEGWRVRYEPSVTVFHDEPDTWRRTLARRFRYGTSAGALSERHPGRLAPLELRPWPTVAAVALLGGRRRIALAVVTGSAVSLARRVRDHGIPVSVSAGWSARATAWTVVGVGRAATMLAGPALVAGILRGRRAAGATLVLAPPLVDWWRRRPDLDPIMWSLASIADDVAYGAGVWAGCLRSRAYGPLVPAVRLSSGRTSERMADLAGGRETRVDWPATVVSGAHDHQIWR